MYIVQVHHKYIQTTIRMQNLKKCVIWMITKYTACIYILCSCFQETINSSWEYYVIQKLCAHTVSEHERKKRNSEYLPRILLAKPTIVRWEKTVIKIVKSLLRSDKSTQIVILQCMLSYILFKETLSQPRPRKLLY